MWKEYVWLLKELPAVFQSGCTFTVPPAMYEGSYFSISLTTLGMISFFFFFKGSLWYLFSWFLGVWLCWVLVVAHRIFSVACELSCSRWDLVSWPGIKPRTHEVLTPGPPGKSLNGQSLVLAVQTQAQCCFLMRTHSLSTHAVVLLFMGSFVSPVYSLVKGLFESFAR